MIASIGILVAGCGEREAATEVQPQIEATRIAEEWPFDQGQNVAAITTRQVIEDGQPVLMVIHYSDDHSWAFLCNTTGEETDGRVIAMGQAVKLDPSLHAIADLPPGWVAERNSVTEQWTRHESPEH